MIENPHTPPPTFTRSELASILSCSIHTIANLEARGQIPPPLRTSSNYRIYTIVDVIQIQMLYHKQLNLNAIVAKLWDKGHTDMQRVGSWVEAAYDEYLKRGSWTPKLPQTVSTDV